MNLRYYIICLTHSSSIFIRESVSVTDSRTRRRLRGIVHICDSQHIIYALYIYHYYRICRMYELYYTRHASNHYIVSTYISNSGLIYVYIILLYVRDNGAKRGIADTRGNMEQRDPPYSAVIYIFYKTSL